ELKRAVALEPTNARFHEGLVQLYAMTQRPAEALVEARRALELDPLSPTANAEVANALLANDRCDEALAQLEKLRSLRPPLNRAVDDRSLEFEWMHTIVDGLQRDPRFEKLRRSIGLPKR